MYQVLCLFKFSLKELPQLQGGIKTLKGGCPPQHSDLLAWLLKEVWLISSCSQLRGKNGDRDADGAACLSVYY